MFATKVKGPRYLEMTEGYVTRIALDENGEIIGYEFVNLGKMMDAIRKGRSQRGAEKTRHTTAVRRRGQVHRPA
jgi:uncharacterized protein YuzE